MAGRPRIYEEVDKEMKLKELVKTACDLFGPPYDDREPDMFTRCDPAIYLRKNTPKSSV